VRKPRWNFKRSSPPNSFTKIIDKQRILKMKYMMIYEGFFSIARISDSGENNTSPIPHPNT
jgi:hypothetical protein